MFDRKQTSARSTKYLPLFLKSYEINKQTIWLFIKFQLTQMNLKSLCHVSVPNSIYDSFVEKQ